jgi:hypothetical protein
MPDLRPIERYTERMTRLEAQAVTVAQRVWRRTRAALIEAIGASGPLQTVQVERIIVDAGAQIGGGFQLVQAAELNDAGVALVSAQTGLDASLLTTTSPDLLTPILGWRSAATGLFLAELGRLTASGADAAAVLARLITGRDGRQSAYDQARVSLQLAAEGAIWAAGNGHVARLADLAGERRGRRYQKQAIAAIDGRTTDCCLRVHGQIQVLDRPFVLTGTPRYADRIQNPPFHHRCRTAVALYLPEMEAIGTPTEQMRAQARAQMKQRGAKGIT